MKRHICGKFHLENWWLIAILMLAIPLCNYSAEVKNAEIKSGLYTYPYVLSYRVVPWVASVLTIAAMIYLLFAPPVIRRKRK
jgi:hypothetical protein